MRCLFPPSTLSALRTELLHHQLRVVNHVTLCLPYSRDCITWGSEYVECRKASPHDGVCRRREIPGLLPQHERCYRLTSKSTSCVSWVVLEVADIIKLTPRVNRALYFQFKDVTRNVFTLSQNFTRKSLCKVPREKSFKIPRSLFHHSHWCVLHNFANLHRNAFPNPNNWYPVNHQFPPPVPPEESHPTPPKNPQKDTP